MIKHIVFWTLHEHADGRSKQENAELIKTRLEALKPLISCIKAIEVGFDFSQAEFSAELALYSAFKTREDLELYQNHPEHIKVKELIGTLASDRQLVDYEI
ncbi:MAG: stress responsive protein [Cycloclasticus sp. symbiont of Poecilosclerida sp. M]|nr:MAG: stress responsive protein [Cycloclasticus sp. symbiont of Poecilosclerida sp. M]